MKSRELHEGSVPYDGDDMDAAVAYAKRTTALFAAGKVAEAYQMYLRDPNGGAAQPEPPSQEQFEHGMYSVRDVQGKFRHHQIDGYSVMGFTVGHRARMSQDGPWGRIEHVAVFEGKPWAVLVFDEPIPDDLGKPQMRDMVPTTTLNATKQPEFEIRRLHDDRLDSGYQAKWQAKSALDEIDVVKPLTFYGIDLDTGKRFLSFDGVTELLKRAQGRADRESVEQDFFAAHDADRGQIMTRKANVSFSVRNKSPSMG